MNFFGEDLLLWLLLALGGALAIGNLLALVRPKAEQEIRAPILRSILMVILGTGVAIWALASLLIS